MMRLLLASLAAAVAMPAAADEAVQWTSQGNQTIAVDPVAVFDEQEPDPSIQPVMDNVHAADWPEDSVQAAVANTGRVVRLTPEQSERAIEAGAAHKVAEEPELRNTHRGVHGEVGMAVGTGGMRSVYGTAAVPIGDDGFAAFSYENTRYGRRQGRP